MAKRKIVYLASGGEEGFHWQLALNIRENVKSFSGRFSVAGELRKQRSYVRTKDRDFFIARLGKKYMADKVLHHNWIENSPEYSKVVLVHKSEHPNGGIDVPRDIDRKRWTANEKWLDSC